MFSGRCAIYPGRCDTLTHWHIGMMCDMLWPLACQLAKRYDTFAHWRIDMMRDMPWHNDTLRLTHWHNAMMCDMPRHIDTLTHGHRDIETLIWCVTCHDTWHASWRSATSCWRRWSRGSPSARSTHAWPPCVRPSVRMSWHLVKVQQQRRRRGSRCGVRVYKCHPKKTITSNYVQLRPTITNHNKLPQSTKD